jgi:hypothetical protein
MGDVRRGSTGAEGWGMFGVGTTAVGHDPTQALDPKSQTLDPKP